MKRIGWLLAASVLTMAITAVTSRAEVNNIQLKIGGYLCGM